MRRRLLVVAVQRRAHLLVGLLADDLTQIELRLAGVLDLDAVAQPIVDLAESELVDDRAGQQARIAHGLDFHLAQHLRDDDLDVLVVDVHALAAVDRLHLADQVVLHRLDAADAQDVVRHQRAVHQRVAGADVVAGVDARVGGVGHLVLLLGPDRLAQGVLRLHPDDALAALAVADAHLAGDLGHHRRVARLAGLEDLRHPRQAAGDVLRAADLPRRLGQQRPGLDLLSVLHFQVRPLGDVVRGQGLPAVVLDDQLRV